MGVLGGFFKILSKSTFTKTPSRQEDAFYAWESQRANDTPALIYSERGNILKGNR